MLEKATDDSTDIRNIKSPSSDKTERKEEATENNFAKRRSNICLIYTSCGVKCFM